MINNKLDKSIIEKYLLKNNEKIKINSKEIVAGDVFIALKGKKTHGNKFFGDAIKRGAEYLITDIEDTLNIDKRKILLVHKSIRQVI